MANNKANNVGNNMDEVKNKELYKAATTQRYLKASKSDYGAKLTDEIRVIVPERDYLTIIIRKEEFIAITDGINEFNQPFEYEIQKPNKGVINEHKYNKEHIIVCIDGIEEVENGDGVIDTDVYVTFLHSSDGESSIESDEDIDHVTFVKLSENQLLNHYNSIIDSNDIQQKIEDHKRSSKKKRKRFNPKSTQL